MSFEADFYAHLVGGSAVTAIVGEHIWPMVRQERSEPPAVTYQVVALTPSNDLDNSDGSLIQYRVQVDAWARKFDDAVALAEAIRARLQTSASSFSALLIPGGGGDAYESDPKIYRRSMDFSCWYTAP